MYRAIGLIYLPRTSCAHTPHDPLHSWNDTFVVHRSLPKKRNKYISYERMNIPAIPRCTHILTLLAARCFIPIYVLSALSTLIIHKYSWYLYATELNYKCSTISSLPLIIFIRYKLNQISRTKQLIEMLTESGTHGHSYRYVVMHQYMYRDDYKFPRDK